jgi:hypothetical protein
VESGSVSTCDYPHHFVQPTNLHFFSTELWHKPPTEISRYPSDLEKQSHLSIEVSMSSAVPLIYTLQAISGLNTLNSYINASSKLTSLFSSSNNFTFLAPTDTAFQSWISSNGNATMDVVEATLSYHLLNGSYPTVAFTDQPQFPSTNLRNQSYENVTIYPPGQRVELINSSAGPVILSSNKTTSTVTQKV